MNYNVLLSLYENITSDDMIYLAINDCGESVEDVMDYLESMAWMELVPEGKFIVAHEIITISIIPQESKIL